jgi:hypothetical protein
MIQSIAASRMDQRSAALQRVRDRQPERAQDQRGQGLAPSGDGRRVRRVSGEIAQLERVFLQVVELMRFVLAYPADVFVSTEASTRRGSMAARCEM